MRRTLLALYIAVALVCLHGLDKDTSGLVFFASAHNNNNKNDRSLVGEKQLTSTGTCPTHPPCHHYSFDSPKSIFNSIMGFVRNPVRCSSYAYDFTNGDDKREMSRRLDTLLSRVVGQDHVVTPVKRDLITKIRNPSMPLVLLFTGDNGVGKTMMANLISLSMSLRCAKNHHVSWNGGCQTGDAALSLHASQVNIGAIKKVVENIAAHARKYPNGVIIINEVFELKKAVFEYLDPLFGRGRAFAEHPDVPLNGLTVILTSDFGKHIGVTQSKSVREIEAMSRTAFAEKFSPRYLSEMSAYSFLPLTIQSAMRACEQEILNLPCRIRNVRSVSVSEGAVSFVVEHSVGLRLAENNGRQIYQTIERQIDGAVLSVISSKFPPSVSDLHVSVRVVKNDKKSQLQVHVRSSESRRSAMEVVEDL